MPIGLMPKGALVRLVPKRNRQRAVAHIAQDAGAQFQRIKGRTVACGPCFGASGTVDIIKDHPGKPLACQTPRVFAGMDLWRPFSWPQPS